MLLYRVLSDSAPPTNATLFASELRLYILCVDLFSLDTCGCALRRTPRNVVGRRGRVGGLFSELWSEDVSAFVAKTNKEAIMIDVQPDGCVECSMGVGDLFHLLCDMRTKKKKGQEGR